MIVIIIIAMCNLYKTISPVSATVVKRKKNTHIQYINKINLLT
jgi:hypothetical protein